MDKRKLLIDTDPGIDDCFAIMSAVNSDVFDILGILCTAGNKSLPVVRQMLLGSWIMSIVIFLCVRVLRLI